MNNKQFLFSPSNVHAVYKSYVETEHNGVEFKEALVNLRRGDGLNYAARLASVERVLNAFATIETIHTAFYKDSEAVISELFNELEKKHGQEHVRYLCQSVLLGLTCGANEHWYELLVHNQYSVLGSELLSSKGMNAESVDFAVDAIARGNDEIARRKLCDALYKDESLAFLKQEVIQYASVLRSTHKGLEKFAASLQREDLDQTYAGSAFGHEGFRQKARIAVELLNRYSHLSEEEAVMLTCSQAEIERIAGWLKEGSTVSLISTVVLMLGAGFAVLFLLSALYFLLLDLAFESPFFAIAMFASMCTLLANWDAAGELSEKLIGVVGELCVKLSDVIGGWWVLLRAHLVSFFSRAKEFLAQAREAEKAKNAACDDIDAVFDDEPEYAYS